jgi:hypothetical protein
LRTAGQQTSLPDLNLIVLSFYTKQLFYIIHII